MPAHPPHLAADMRLSVPSFFALILIALGAPAPLGASPLHWQETEVTIDAPPLAETVEAAFRFTNTSTRPVTISEVHSSCGCTVPQLEQKIYVPGESGTIRAVFTIGERLGLQEKAIMVTTAAPDASSVPLTLRVRIPTLYEVKPFFVIWNLGDAPVAKTVDLRLLAPEVLKFDSITSRHTNFTAVATPAVDDPNRLSLEITPQVTTDATNGAIEVALKAQDGRTRVVTLYALVREGRPTTPRSTPGGPP
ncbi:MAG: DUF1573 domain-containing protein [Opitutaceae bacterium]|nr:DUF1573 domain-containing protein [Opitutaceae bacterium]